MAAAQREGHSDRHHEIYYVKCMEVVDVNYLLVYSPIQFPRDHLYQDDSAHAKIP